MSGFFYSPPLEGCPKGGVVPVAKEPNLLLILTKKDQRALLELAKQSHQTTQIKRFFVPQNEKNVVIKRRWINKLYINYTAAITTA